MLTRVHSCTRIAFTIIVWVGLLWSCGHDKGFRASDGSVFDQDGTIEVGVCGDGVCRLKAGENAHLCPQDCGQPSGSTAVVRFFADFPTAPEPGRKVRFTYVVWNEGDQPARNVVLAVPVVLNPDTPLIGDLWWCDIPDRRYDCMEDLSYVPGSMRINRVYHPNRARNSYAFVDTLPLTDEPDDDEAYFNQEINFLFLTVRELAPRSQEPETSGLVWSYELAVDGACEENPLVQNWNYLFADNAEPYTNDIIGHVYCESPHLRARLETSQTLVNPGELVEVEATMSFDTVVPPPGKEISRFVALRPRLYLDYPESWIEVAGISEPDEAEDLPGFHDEAQGGGVVYWERRDQDGDAEILPGESETLTVTLRVAQDLPTGLQIPIHAFVLSQRTVSYQNEDAELILTVVNGASPACGDGVCSDGEDLVTCSEDCPLCAAEDQVTSFGNPPCCDGLVLVRASHPYSWAYDQCYDWEGGGAPFAQGYCTYCGDTECSGKENACNCPEDCGPHCGNWQCEEGESRATCPSDC